MLCRRKNELLLPTLDVVCPVLLFLRHIDLRVLATHTGKVSEVFIWFNVVGLANSIDDTITGLHIGYDIIASMGFVFIIQK